MHTSKYTLKDFLSDASLEQLVIPEIQRDYVWEVEHIMDILSTFQDGFNGSEQDRPYLGFVYAYNDKDHPYKYFVVDGQQRLTSIYIILVLCYQIINKPLPNYLQSSGKLKLDYKVRQSTHDFLNNLINQLQSDLSEHDFIIEEQLWFHSSYKNDKTISNLIQNFYAVKNRLKEIGILNIPNFIKYIENKVQLSYFDIENGREGEELYIYMNARGKQLEINETLKAKFLGNIKEDDRLIWGLKWEKWQDYFWKYKGENQDADAGFDEFLRRVQILHMCSVGKSNSQISNFSSEKSDLKINTEFLPNKIDELEEYFNAFKTMVESKVLKDFYYKYESSLNYLTETPKARKRQIYYFNTLPILSFIKESKVIDEKTIFRFVRFFYNISRKSNIGKDISSQLPSAIKLIQEYVSTTPISYDVTDLKDFSNNRSVLLNQEELIKLQSYKEPPIDLSREELENLFWSMEDHPIYNGEIEFLLQNEKLEYDLSFERIKNEWITFQTLFPLNNIKSNNTNIIRALLFYGNTWFQHSPYYYKNYNCADWSLLVTQKSGKYLKSLLTDMYDKPLSHLDNIIKTKISIYFNNKNLNTIETIKSSESLLDQVKVLAAIDYYSNKILWTKANYCIAEDGRFIYESEVFFQKDRLLYNIERYIGDGNSNRVLFDMKIILKNVNKIKGIIDQIFLQKDSNSLEL